MQQWLLGLIVATITGGAHAKLPPPSPEAQAVAAETKAKAAWGEKVAAYQLCLAQNKTAERYFKEKGGSRPQVDTPPCTNPGPYVAQSGAQETGVADSKPVPAAGKDAQAGNAQK